MLNQLRDDLQLNPAPSDSNGHPSWTLFDPVRDKFFHFDWLEFELLSRWNYGNEQAVANSVIKQTAIDLSLEKIVEKITILNQFLEINQLIQSPLTIQNKVPVTDTSNHKSNTGWLLDNYLFLKIPLLNPDQFLTNTLGLVRWLYSYAAMLTFSGLFLIGIFLVTREWQQFQNTFVSFMNIQGILFLAIAIFISKIIHELAHAYTAKLYGLRVPTMGVAFLVLWPVLYTDTTAAWRLTSRKQRLNIAIAGIAAELGLAIIATLLWSFLPVGELKSIAFFLAATTWIMTLLINLNPFMRFDGYYILSDSLNLPNMQTRAFALSRWKLRNLLFGLNTPAPENLPPAKNNFLILYGYATWIYRVIIFTAIAVMVYYLTFKVLGIFLMLVELWVFLVRPVVREISVWIQARHYITFNHHTTGLLLLLFVLGWLLLYPWNSTLRLPAIMKYNQQNLVMTPVAGEVVYFRPKLGDKITAGDLLLKIESSELKHKQQLLEAEIITQKQFLQTLEADHDLLKKIPVTKAKLAELISQLSTVKKERHMGNLYAPISGKITFIAPQFMEENPTNRHWVTRGTEITQIINHDKLFLETIVKGRDLELVKPSANAVFYPADMSISAINAKVDNIAQFSLDKLPESEFSTLYGGDIPSKKKDRGLIPLVSSYKITLTPESGLRMAHKINGTVHIQAPAVSLFQSGLRQVRLALLRESGF